MDRNTVVPERLEHLQDELTSVTLDNFDGMLTRDAAMSVASDIINWLDNEGWLVDLPYCSKTEPDTGGQACENLVQSPTDDFCPDHNQ